MTTDNLTTDRPTRSTDWANAVHNYQREQAAYVLVAKEYEAACAEYDRDRNTSVYDPAEKKHDAACGKLFDARDKPLNTPAPDAEALQFKLDILAALMAEHDVEDAPAVAVIRDDAKRVLGSA